MHLSTKIGADKRAIVADSSYLVEGLLKDASLLEHDIIVAPELALYEVANSIWKHEAVLGDINDGRQYLDLLFQLVSTETVRFISPDERIAGEAYKLALTKKCTVYDAIFVALAIDLGLELKTFDEAQHSLLP
ncbi:MAG: type II toxin-antitoxin system VapC family toxin [Nitrososphaera sp.]